MYVTTALWRDRYNFGSFLNRENLTGIAVEIGTHQGTFAHHLLQQWSGKMLYCVDPWTKYDETDPASCGDRDQDKATCERVLSRFHNVTIKHMFSETAVFDFKDNSLDFVYVDGNHQPDHVGFDIYAWYRKLKKGGILAGHDIICPGEKDGGWGKYIFPIVYSFCETYDLNLILVTEITSLPWSYYVRKK